MRLLIHTDGAARGNPGPAGAGAILRDAADGSVLAEIAKGLGRATNNVAEWTAVHLALQEARRLGATHVDLRMDSELVARQITGIYRVRHPDLKPIHARAPPPRPARRRRQPLPPGRAWCRAHRRASRPAHRLSHRPRHRPARVASTWPWATR
ncbi:MAG: ribonuclease HI family protein [Chloroflexi bacterium]|nr:ribonuclease HI family protein [Chloroflexota bacterium]